MDAFPVHVNAPWQFRVGFVETQRVTAAGQHGPMTIRPPRAALDVPLETIAR